MLFLVCSNSFEFLSCWWTRPRRDICRLINQLRCDDSLRSRLFTKLNHSNPALTFYCDSQLEETWKTPEKTTVKILKGNWNKKAKTKTGSDKRKRLIGSTRGQKRQMFDVFLPLCSWSLKSDVCNFNVSSFSSCSFKKQPAEDQRSLCIDIRPVPSTRQRLKYKTTNIVTSSQNQTYLKKWSIS